MTNLRKKIIAGNWKMNLNVQEASLLLHQIAEVAKVHRDVEVVIAPTMLALQSLSLQVNHRKFKFAAQNFYWRDHGAFTGEVSANQLRGLVEYGLVGHSERRHIFNDSDKDIRAKVQAALRNGFSPILCVGETTSERAGNETKDVLHDQLIGGLANVSSDELKNIVVAYEPVWAIGTGKNALPADVRDAVASIRSQIKHLYGKVASEEIRVLYGGSVTDQSAADYLAIHGVDGLLIGGASLDARQFSAIIKMAHSKATKK